MDEHDEIAELLGAYALDAVDPDEREAVERHLVECPRCAAEVADHREVAAMLSHTGGDAPEGVWARIEASLEEPPPELRLPSAIPDELAERRSRGERRPWLVAAAAAVALVVGLVAGVVIGDDGDGRGGELPVALDEVARRTLNDPDATRVTLASPDESLSVAAAVAPDGSGYLVGTSLPPLEEARTYQLWGQHEGTVVSLGVLGPAPGVVAFHVSPGTEALMITEEVAGGVPQSVNDAVVAAELS